VSDGVARSPRVQLAARIGVLAIALAAALYLWFARYAIGLDFMGGAHIVYRIPSTDAKTKQAELDKAVAEIRARVDAESPAKAIVVPRGNSIIVEAEDADRDDVAKLARFGDVESSSVIEPNHQSWLGRPASIALAWLGLLLWLVAFVTRRAEVGFAAAFVTAWPLAIATLMWHGGTLTMPCHVTGVLAGMLAAAAAILAARTDGSPRARLRAAWPAGAALLGVYLLISIAHGALPRSFLGWGIKFLVLALPVTAVFAAIAIFATPVLRSSRA
jgi:hypothetical protein